MRNYTAINVNWPSIKKSVVANWFPLNHQRKIKLEWYLSFNVFLFDQSQLMSVRLIFHFSELLQVVNPLVMTDIYGPACPLPWLIFCIFISNCDLIDLDEKQKTFVMKSLILLSNWHLRSSTNSLYWNLSSFNNF